MNNKKVIISVAPVSHTGKPVPSECRNPTRAEDVAAEVINCARAGAAMVYLHVRDETGEQTFDLSMIETSMVLANEGVIDRPLHFNFCLGYRGALSATARNLGFMQSLVEEGAHWGFTHDGMPDFSMLACALGMGARVVRVGFEDSFYYAPGKTAKTTAELVERLAGLVRSLGLEPATPAEAREILHL